MTFRKRVDALPIRPIGHISHGANPSLKIHLLPNAGTGRKVRSSELLGPIPIEILAVAAQMGTRSRHRRLTGAFCLDHDSRRFTDSQSVAPHFQSRFSNRQFESCGVVFARKTTNRGKA